MEKVYAVIVSYACDDDYYPDYAYVYCICSSKEKADRMVKILYEKNKDADPTVFIEAHVVEYVLDDMEELEND